MTHDDDPGGGVLALVAIYADESCLGNGREGDNPGAAAGVIEFVSPATQRLSRWDYWVSERGTTNNRMALRSIIEAFRVISRKGSHFRVSFTSDSQYLVKGSRISVYRRGTEFVIVPLAIRVVDGRETISARNPKTGDGLELFVDEVERLEIVR